MNAAVLQRPGEFRMQRVAVPDCGAGDVLVAIEGSGVCASSIPVFEGREWFSYPLPPGAPGHEGWGRVAAIGAEVIDLKVGDRVAGLTSAAFAQFDVVPAAALVKISEEPDAVPLEAVGCGFNILRRAQIDRGQRVALLGGGFLSLLLVQLLRDVAGEVIVVARNTAQLEQAEQLGAHRVVRMDDHHRIIDWFRQHTAEMFCPCVIELTGAQWPLDLAGELTAINGRLVVGGYHQDGLRKINMQLWNWRGIDVINAHERHRDRIMPGMREAADAIASGRVDLAPLLTHYMPMNELDRAMRLTCERPEGFVKAVVLNGSGS